MKLAMLSCCRYGNQLDRDVVQLHNDQQIELWRLSCEERLFDAATSGIFALLFELSQVWMCVLMSLMLSSLPTAPAFMLS